jgi:uncharacterized repeat protein (TIGR01451 family)/LPXTG-motif cell wall-anchored protein
VHGLVCEIGDLAAGEEVNVDIFLTIDPFARVRIWNRAWTYADQPETNTIKEAGTPCGDNSNTDGWTGLTGAFPPDPEPYFVRYPSPAGVGCNYAKKNATPKPELDLSVTKTDSQDPVSPEGVFSYFIEVTNAGPAGAFAVVATDELPDEVSFVSADAGCTYDGATNEVSCDIGPMAPGDLATRTITVQVNPGVFDTTILNGVCVENQEDPQFAPIDIDPSNDCDEEPTDIPDLGSVGDRVWIDSDADGVQDPGEEGINGVTLTLGGDAAGTKETTTGPVDGGSDVPGWYLFDGLLAGTYTVTVTVPDGYVATTPTELTVVLAEEQVNLDVDFGIVALGSIGDRVWIDSDADGVQDAGEVGFNGATVTLSGDGAGTDTTAGDGNYLFDGLVAGNYTSSLTVPAGFTATTPTSVDVVLAAGEDFLDADFGIVADEPGPVTGQIGDRVWFDVDADGVQDAGEVGINGVTLTLSGAGAGTDVTVGDGDYVFTELPAGTYTVVVTPPAGYTATTPTSVTYTLADGEIYLDADFGFTQLIDLELSKTVSPESIVFTDTTQSGTFSWTITVINQGPADATGVVVEDTLPSGLVYVSDTGGGSFNPSTGIWTIGVLDVGESVSLTIVTSVTAQSVISVGGSATFVNFAEVIAADQEDVDSVPDDGVGDDADSATAVVSIVLGSETLPTTGANADVIGAAGMVFLALGAFVLLLARRRNDGKAW